MDKTPVEILSLWAKGASSESSQVEEEYDILAETYNETLRAWQYESPRIAAELMKKFVSKKSKILDAGCGTGLTGTALREEGYNNIIGADISGTSLEIACKADAYTELCRLDMQKPLPFQDNEFDAVECIGVLTYIENTSLLHEFCRIVRPGGHVVFSQREDICHQRNYETELREMEESALWKQKFMSEPAPYLPKNADYAEKIKVQYFVYEICVNNPICEN